MPHSFPIDPASSNRAQRRKAQESSGHDTIQVKANIGAMRGTVRTASQGFDPDAFDGDGDLRVQDGTAFERPAMPRMPELRSGLQSYTGASRNDYSRLTNGERAEKAVPDSPMQFLADLKRMAEETLGEPLDIEELKQVIDEAGLAFDFSPESVSKMRDAVRAALDNNPKFADTVSRLGLPPIVAVDKGLPFLVSGGFADPAPFIGLKMSHLEQGRVFRALRKMSDKLPFISAEGVDRRLVSDDPDSLIVHEAGHWFAYSASMLGTTDEQREIASLFYTQSWPEWNKLYPTLKSRRAKSLSRLGRAIQEAVDEEGPLPIDAPFVNSEYGMSSPVETFAEGVTAMLSADENLMELIDTNLADIIKTVLGDAPTGDTTGLRSQTYQRTRSYDIDEIVDAVVPDNTADLRRLFKEYGDLFSGGFIDDERINDEQLDFSPKTISNLRETVRDALEGNPIFAEVVSRYGMPPIFALKDSVYNYAARAHLTYGGAIEFAPETHKRKFGFLTNLAQRGFYSEGNAHYKGTQSLTASDRATVLMHEYGHYLHNLASVSSPNRRVREMLDWFHSEEWSYLDRDEIPPSFRKLARAMTEVDMRDYDYTLERQDDLPFINSKYGMSSPSEFIAEAFALAVGKKTAGKRKHLSSHTEDLVDVMLGDKAAPNVHAFDEPASFLDDDPFTGQAIQRGLRSATVPALGRAGTDNNRQMMTPVRPTRMDWLKDFSHEEIAEIVVPTSLHDSIILMAQLRLGPDFDIAKKETFKEIRKVEMQLLDNGERCLDFSPEAREAMKQELVRALDSSPTFSEFVKMFGLPPILFVGDAEYQSRKGDKSKLFSTLQKKNRPIGWYEPGYFMTFNGSDRSWQADAPTGSFPTMRQDRFGKPMISNVGIDRVSVIHHEYAHYLWTVLTQNRGTERLKALGWTEDQVDKMQDTLKTMFDIRYGTVIPKTMRRVDYQVVNTPGGGLALEEALNPYYDYWNYITWAENNGMPSVLSMYGHTNPQEMWAESFASFVSSKPITSGFINDNFVMLMKDLFSLEEDESEDETMEAPLFRLPKFGEEDDEDVQDEETSMFWSENAYLGSDDLGLPEPPANLTARQLQPTAKRIEGLRSSTQRSVPANAETEQIRQLLQDADEKADEMIGELTSANGAVWDRQTRKGEPYSDLIDADEAKKAEDSVRIYVSSDGRPIVRAEPHPIVRRIFGDLVDSQNAYEIPKREVIKTLAQRYNELIADISAVDSEGFYNITLPDGTKVARFKTSGTTTLTDENAVQKVFEIPNIELEILDDRFSHLIPEQLAIHMGRDGVIDMYRQLMDIGNRKYVEWIKNKVKNALGPNFQEKTRELVRDNTNNPFGLGYIAGLHNPEEVLPFFPDAVGFFQIHDPFGHFGMGNGFDRHGEFGNMLSMLQLIDLAVAEGAIEPHEADLLKHRTISIELQRMAAGRFDEELDPELNSILYPIGNPPPRTFLAGQGYQNQASKFYVGNLTEDFQRPLTEASREQGTKGLRSSTQRFNPKAEQFADAIRVESRDVATRQMISDIDERINRGGLASSTRKPKTRTPKTRSTQAHDSRFKDKYGSDVPYGDGDCYSSAVSTAEALSRSGVQNVRVVHGIPLGTGGEAEGIRYPHAWVEATINGEEMVIDNSNGGNYVLPKELYYLIGNIEEDVTRRYSYQEAQNQMTENGHYGPWE
jgi:hypothetical protein